ncbi:hypothetical protein BOTBODRAFT_481234 [Botryobasidium botryosum FD-172 SS1]|uniref:Zn(2)-C6 fungal-type domain-containing protein n=1 Tax=Botryobasidium botryosum (strain FD-172 SS1) TaxID=930990 RepID=A0A067MTT1_BOTB1|nr:hypothetical protein BOTBODRAFT_481234 [Botryobasidium botryosum FD-172 SS1]
MEEPSPNIVTVLVRGNACIICRRKKRRCDGAQPACAPCIRTGTRNECSYGTDPERAQVKLLEGRLKDLRNRIRDLEISQPPNSSAVVLPHPPPLAMTATSRTPITLPIQSPNINAATFRNFILSPRAARRSHSLSVPTSLRDPFAGLSSEQDNLANIRYPLIEIFMKNRWHYFTEWDPTRFWTLYKLPASHPESLHPALLDVMCLLGCIHNTSSLLGYERLFYARLQRSLVDCLKHADRLYDFIRASVLAGLYCHYRKRYTEGQNHQAATIHFAMACGLHKIETYDLRSSGLSSLIKPPKAIVDLGDMIHTWWGLYCLDRMTSVLLECPFTIPKDEEAIKTVWPCAFEDYVNGVLRYAPYSGIGSLFLRIDDPLGTLSPYDNIFTFRAKSIAMLFHAITLASSYKEEHIAAEQSHSTDAAIEATSRLIEAMLVYRESTCPVFSRTRYYEDDGHDGTLIYAISTAYAALIQLLSALAEKDVESYRKRLLVARACVALGLEARRTDPILLHALIHVYSSHGLTRMRY